MCCNIEAIHRNRSEIYGFKYTGPYYGPVLFINGKDSYQHTIQNHIKFYQRSFPSATAADLIEVPNAGHGVHFDQPQTVARHLHNFLLKNVVQEEQEEQMHQLKP